MLCVPIKGPQPFNPTIRADMEICFRVLLCNPDAAKSNCKSSYVTTFVLAQSAPNERICCRSTSRSNVQTCYEQEKGSPLLGHYMSVLVLHPDSMLASHWTLTFRLIKVL